MVNELSKTVTYQIKDAIKMEKKNWTDGWVHLSFLNCKYRESKDATRRITTVYHCDYAIDFKELSEDQFALEF